MTDDPVKAMTDRQHDDLDWQAFRYVAAEMDPDEVVRFEEQLLDDQRCRDAVARAVELAEAVAVVLPDRPLNASQRAGRPAPRVKSGWRARIGWVGVGAAATLACVILLQAIRGGARPDAAARQDPETMPDSEVAADPDAARLALLWCRTRDELAETSVGSWPAGLVAPFDETNGATPGAEDTADRPDAVIDDDNLPDDQIDPAVSVPSWMVAAVAGEMELSSDGLPPPED
jgi:hypothetical protein